MISVVIPVYNRQDKVSAAIESIQKQTYQDFNIILVDDGSTDNTPAVCDSLAKQDTRIQVIHQENQGVSQARNTGLLHANGEWLIFMDSDDTVEPIMYEKLIEAAEKSDADLVVCGITNTFFNLQGKQVRQEFVSAPDEILTSDKRQAERVLSLLKGSLIHSPVNKLYRTAFIKTNNLRFLPEISLGEDLIFNLQYLKFSKSVVLISDCLYTYRAEEGDGLVSAYRNEKHIIMTQLYHYVLEYVAALDDIPENHQKADFLYLKWTYSCFMELFKKACPLSRREKLLYIKKINAIPEVMEAAKFGAKEGRFNAMLANALLKHQTIKIYYYSKLMFLAKFRLSPLYNKLLKKV